MTAIEIARAEVMDHIRKARIVRTSQMKHRDGKRSTVTDFEDALLFLAWEAEILSEGQMAKILDLDRVTLRKQRESFIAYATVVAEALLPKAPSRRSVAEAKKPNLPRPVSELGIGGESTGVRT